MKESIFLRKEDGSLIRMERSPYEKEDVLQELLAEHPDLLAGEGMERSEPRRWVLVKRELPVPGEEGGGKRWALDHLFLDQDAVPTLVEVKRSSDTRARREVVAQMLDYAANLVEYCNHERLRSDFEETCRQRGMLPADELERLTGEDLDEEAYWGQVKEHLQVGRVRLVFVADEISPELHRIIEFLNGQMDPATVLGVEVPQFVGEGLRTLVPRVVGLTMEAQTRKAAGGPRTRTTREELLASYPATARDALDRFFAQCERQDLKLKMGDNGCSVRMRLPDGSKTISAAWVYPPGAVGWMNLRGIAVGCDRSLLTEEPFAAAFQEYFDGVSRLRGAVPQPSGYVAGVELPAENAADQLSAVVARIAELRERLEEIDKARRG